MLAVATYISIQTSKWYIFSHLSFDKKANKHLSYNMKQFLWILNLTILSWEIVKTIQVATCLSLTGWTCFIWLVKLMDVWFYIWTYNSWIALWEVLFHFKFMKCFLSLLIRSMQIPWSPDISASFVNTIHTCSTYNSNSSDKHLKAVYVNVGAWRVGTQHRLSAQSLKGQTSWRKLAAAER